ncbi:MAG: alanyl-tRNA editing protein AlaXM [Thermoproteota archaeon]|nr:alanyl-tRNA editing protein [Candidatus Brockarchaeota archaeon]
MTEKLFMKDSYLKACEATIQRVENNNIILNRTIFHPLSGGVSNDLGKIIYQKYEYNIVEVREDKESETIIHTIGTAPKLKVGDIVRCELDWDRRYRLMKLHTAAHILSAIMYNKYNALITGGHIEPEEAKDDYSIEKADRSLFEEAIREVNEIVSRAIEVKVYFLPREEALRIKGVVKLAERAPPNLKELRIVEIPGVDIQADGGPHVKNTSEIGRIVLSKVENKGKNRKRVYYKLQE